MGMHPALVRVLRCIALASGHKPLRRASLKNSPDQLSTPLLLPPATIERMKMISFEMVLNFLIHNMLKIMVLRLLDGGYFTQ